MYNTLNLQKKKDNAKIKNTLFYGLLIILPLIQFAIFYVWVNINSILLSFQNITKDGVVYSLDNFKKIFSETQLPIMKKSLANSAIIFAWKFFVGMTLAMVFSYYIFKKMPGHDFFKIILFLPTIVSSVVMVIMYRFMVDGIYPYLATGKLNTEGLITNVETRFNAVVFYNLWVGAGTQVLLYLGAMNNVSDSALEACKIDGANAIQEFLHVVFPGIYSTFMVFVTINIAEFFTNQMALHAFFGFNELAGDYNFYTVGYYLYWLVGKAENDVSALTYPSAIGVLCTLIVIPITFIVKGVLTAVGPKED